MCTICSVKQYVWDSGFLNRADKRVFCPQREAQLRAELEAEERRKAQEENERKVRGAGCGGCVLNV